MRFTACSAIPSAERGGCLRVQEKPVGSTIRRSAPSSSAADSGVLLASAPSESWRPAICTGGKIGGLGAVASTRAARTPQEQQPPSPPNPYRGAQWQGALAAARPANAGERRRAAAHP